MPLIIAVLIILVVIVSARESNKKNATQSAIREKDRRKTNAKLEHHILDTYMKHGYSFDEAFDKAYQDMIEAGYDPCIPRSAYKNREGIESSSCGVYGGNDVENREGLRYHHRKRRWRLHT